MPIRVSASSELGLAGVVKADEFNRYVGPLPAASEYGLLPLTLVDMTAALRAEGSADVARHHARRAADNIDSKIEPGARMAFAAPEDVWFGFGRMYQALRDESSVEIGVFRSLCEAEHWLGLPDECSDHLSDAV